MVAKSGYGEIGCDPTQKKEMAEPMSRMVPLYLEQDSISEIDQDLSQVVRTRDKSKPSTYWEAVDSFSIGLVVDVGRAKFRQQTVMPILLILGPKA
jgi:hypothetical protein